MGATFRKDTGKWGYQVYRAGKRHKRFAWATKAAADKACREFIKELNKQPRVPDSALGRVAAQYLIESRMKGRSMWRLMGLRYNFEKFIIPYFGPATSITEIKPKHIEMFALGQRGRVKNNTIWHYVTDIRSMFNWAKRQDLVSSNPVEKADLNPIRQRKFIKMPLDPSSVDQAVEVLSGIDRCYFNFLRFTGLRKDEANRVRWEDVDLDRSLLMVRGTKTEESLDILPIAPVLKEELSRFKKQSFGDLLFPGQKGKNKGKKIYARRRMFERIRQQTGIKLVPKDLRDYFATEVAAQAKDPVVVMRLLRHTNLATTSKYLRTVEDRMVRAVENLGVNPRGQFVGQKGSK